MNPVKKTQPSKIQKIKKPNIPIDLITLNASGEILGRLSTKVAILLRGKDLANFQPNIICRRRVVVLNAGQIKTTGKKMNQKMYYRHSGYLGNLKSQTMAEIYKKNPAKILELAVWGMLPKNKLRKVWMRNLQIYNGEKDA